MVDSTATRLTTGIDPGRPRHVGHTCVLASLPKDVEQAQNILEFVPSSTWVSSPRTGSKRPSACSYGMNSSVLIAPEPPR